MSTFFLGWRRKLGIVLLVTVCTLTAEWVRSIGIEDNLHLYRGNWEFFAGSTNGGLYFSSLLFDDTITMRPSKDIPFWMSIERSRDRFIGVDQLPIEWNWKWRGFRYAHSDLDFGVIIPFWSIVIPLTVLTAYLLLGKPPKPRQTKITEPIPIEGA